MSNQFFQYSLNSNNNQQFKHIATLDPVQSDGLIKGIQSIISYCNPAQITITNSQAVHCLLDGAGLLVIDLEKLLNSKISLRMINHSGLSKSLSLLMNGKTLTISTVHQYRSYRFVAGTSEVNFPIAFMDESESFIPNFQDAIYLGAEVELNDTTLFKGKGNGEPIQIHLYGGQLSMVRFADSSAHYFSRITLSEGPNEPDLLFHSFAFLRCTGKKAVLRVVNRNEDHWLITESLLGVGLKATVFEPLFNVF